MASPMHELQLAHRILRIGQMSLVKVCGIEWNSDEQWDRGARWIYGETSVVAGECNNRAYVRSRSIVAMTCIYIQYSNSNRTPQRRTKSQRLTQLIVGSTQNYCLTSLQSNHSSWIAIKHPSLRELNSLDLGKSTS